MKNIIAYSMEKLYKDLEEADKLFLSSGMKDMELYEKQLAEAARKAAAEHMAALYSDMDRMLCEDISRAEKYTIQRHDERQLLTTVGPVCFTHTLFRSRKDGTCHYLLDEWMELDAHERLSSRAEAERCISCRMSMCRVRSAMENGTTVRHWKSNTKERASTMC